MKTLKRRGTVALFVLLTTLGLVALAVTACGDGEEEPSPTPAPTPTVEQPTPAPTPAPTAAPEPTPTEADHDHEEGEISFDAASATITVDGDNADWSDIEGVSVPMEQLRLENLDPAQVIDMEIEFGELDPVDVVLKVASDADNVYVLVEVPDDYDFDPADHNLSASIAVMFRIDEPAPPHMGAEEEDLETSLGVVDIWHWELDCEAGVMSGGGEPGDGDDPDCNLDDEYAPNPEDREDDGTGDVANPDAENSLSGVWEHTARAEGAGADGVWIFEMSRPLQTGDPQDVQLEAGDTAHIALAYFDADETPEGWTDTGHLQSTYNGWIEATLP